MVEKRTQSLFSCSLIFIMINKKYVSKKQPFVFGTVNRWSLQIRNIEINRNPPQYMTFYLVGLVQVMVSGYNHSEF